MNTAITDDTTNMLLNSSVNKSSRSTSIAYAAVSPTSSIWNKLMFYIRVNSRGLMATIVFVCFVLVFSSDAFQSQKQISNVSHSVDLKNWGGLRGAGQISYFGGAYHPGYFNAEDAIVDKYTFQFSAVTDLDQLSRSPNSNKLAFQSALVPGTIARDPATNQYTVRFEEARTLKSPLNEGGRGMELSELTLYKNRLLAFDDRTGTVFEILNKNEGKDSIVVPRLIITEGDGDNSKGMKWEWASVKGNELYMGSMGKEYTRPDGSIQNTNNLWIAIVDSEGRVRRKDWSKNYDFVRTRLGASAPGYVIHEAILWSEHLKKWVFIPRRISSDMYDENEDERKGSNKLVLVDENFTTADIIDIRFKVIDPLHGFSTFAFVPGSNDHHALAVRTVEEDCVGGDENMCKQRSYFVVFNVLTGDVLMDEVELLTGSNMKFEGVEFINIHTPEPPSVE